jgi:hypothetical protein
MIGLRSLAIARTQGIIFPCIKLDYDALIITICRFRSTYQTKMSNIMIYEAFLENRSNSHEHTACLLFC